MALQCGFPSVRVGEASCAGPTTTDHPNSPSPTVDFSGSIFQGAHSMKVELPQHPSQEPVPTVALMLGPISCQSAASPQAPIVATLPTALSTLRPAAAEASSSLPLQVTCARPVVLSCCKGRHLPCLARGDGTSDLRRLPVLVALEDLWTKAVQARRRAASWMSV